MRHTLFSSIAVAGLLVVAACGQKPGEQRPEAQDQETTNVAQDAAGAATGVATGAVGALSTDAFVKDAAIAGMYEIEAAKLALQRTKSPDVKAAAQMILKDHEAADKALKALVAGGKAPGPLPTALDERRKGMIDNLKGASAVDFDDRYLDQQTMAHHEALLLMNGYKAAGSVEPLKAFAAEVAPKIQMHLDKVHELQAAMKK